MATSVNFHVEEVGIEPLLTSFKANPNIIINCVMKQYTLEKAKPDSTKNVLLLKNPQFLSNHNETLPK